jgi:hypothetical protein
MQQAKIPKIQVLLITVIGYLFSQPHGLLSLPNTNAYVLAGLYVCPFNKNMINESFELRPNSITNDYSTKFIDLTDMTKLNTRRIQEMRATVQVRILYLYRFPFKKSTMKIP